MRATTTITWLLLSLSFLLPSVCSDNDSQTTASVSKNETSATSAPTGGNPAGVQQSTVSSQLKAADTNVAPTDPGKEDKTSQPQTTLNPPAAITTPDAKVTTAPISKPRPTQPQAPIDTNNPVAPTTAIPGVVNNSTSAAAADVTSGPAAAGDQGATASSNSPAVAPNSATLQTPATTLPSNNARTTVPTGPAGNTVNTPKATQASTDALTNGKQPTARTTVTSKTTPQDGKDITVGAPTVSGAPPPPGNPGTTLTPTTLTRTGPPAAGTLCTKAVTTSMSATHTTHTTATTAATPKTFQFSLNKGPENEEEKELVKVCKRLMENLKDGNCTLRLRHHDGKIQFEDVEINGKVSTELANQIYEEINKKPTDNKTLIAILASCGALLIMIVILAVCASHHRRPYNENQQHLTEELHTVENGYHDNPTLEVMEVQPEMQEKKMALNGEFNDSWIVPIDNLLKEVPDEEDTHL